MEDNRVVGNLRMGIKILYIEKKNWTLKIKKNNK